MRALAWTPANEQGVLPPHITTWNNNTLTEMYNMIPKGTSCIFIEFKLYNDSKGEVPYQHNQISI